MIQSSNNNGNVNGSGGYTKLDVRNFVENGSAFVCRCCRICRPWQFKLLLLLLSGVLLYIWLFNIDILNGTYLPFLVNQQTSVPGTESDNNGADPFTYAKLDMTNFYGHNSSNNSTTQVNNNATQRINGHGGGKKLITECRLPRVDPWDPMIQPYLDPSYYMNWLRDCKREYPELTQLINGHVVLHPEAKNNGTHCQFKWEYPDCLDKNFGSCTDRCLYPHTDLCNLDGAWKEIGEKPDCDVVETQCQHQSIQNNTFYYNYLHAQIYRKDKPKEGIKMLETTTSKPPEETVVDIERTPDFGPDNGQLGSKIRPPDVHVFVLDSVSQTQFLRTMPKTVTWLRERMGAVSFQHLNKVGINSRPNAYAMFFGFQTSPVNSSPMGEGYKPPRDLGIMKSVYLDKEPFVGFEYRERGYRTMMAEDWGQGAFNWPGCYGFERAPVDHYMRPFQLRLETINDPGNRLYANTHKKSCKETHHHVMRYLLDFIDAYEEQPKFSLSWMTELAHWNQNGLYRLDEEIYRFLGDYEKKLNNAFLFIMGDHGLRFSPIRSTKQGEVEDNNPALFMVLPKHLRYNNRLADNLRENARQLITHFDVHATLVNIARQSSSMNVHTPFDVLAPELKGPTPLGQSLLYPLDKTVPRNCANLKIPLEHCQCQFQTKNATETEPTLGKVLAEAMVVKMNADIALNKYDGLCAHLTLKPDQRVELIELEPDQHVDMFKVTFETVPGEGRFWGFMQVQDRGLPTQQFAYNSHRFPRLNAYAAQAYCAINHYAIAAYCYCKDLLISNETTATNTTETPSATTKSQQQQQQRKDDDIGDVNDDGVLDLEIY